MHARSSLENSTLPEINFLIHPLICSEINGKKVRTRADTEEKRKRAEEAELSGAPVWLHT